MSEEWGPWIEHDGRSRPQVGTYVFVEDGRKLTGEMCIVESFGEADAFLWDTIPVQQWEQRVLRYRIRKPKGLTILEKLIADLPETVGAA